MGHLRILQAAIITTLTLLISCGANLETAASFGEAPASQPNSTAVETDVSWCLGMGDVFELDAPGTYTVFASDPDGPLSTEVRGSHGEWLAQSHPEVLNTSAVDVPTGLRFGVAPSQVFNVESAVTIRVEPGESAYQLVVVRISGARAFSSLVVRPHVEQVINESGSCLIGNLRETFKIRTQAVYSDSGARQIFIVDSPNRVSEL